MKTNRFFLLTGALLTLTLISCDALKGTSNEVRAPHNIIPVNKGIMMKDTYKNDVQAIIERNREQGTYQATEFAWVNLDSLKKYIAMLDKVSELNNKKITGIRIYFSQYPSNANYSQEERDRLIPGRETLFFAPTTQIASTRLSKMYPVLENVPFSIQSTGTNPYIGNFKVISRLLGSNEQMPVDSTRVNRSLTTETETSIILNELAMYPPPKN